MAAADGASQSPDTARCPSSSDVDAGDGNCAARLSDYGKAGCGVPGGDAGAVLELVTRAKREFHSRRFIKCRHLPADVTEEDIHHLLQSVEIKSVQLNRASQTAKVTPMTPESLDEWPCSDEQQQPIRHILREQRVSVSTSVTRGMLCVAHLPLIFGEQEFLDLVQMYGPVARCFLLRSERDGANKGYGFVEYSSSEVAVGARHLLNRKRIGDCVLQCNWLDPSHVTYTSLHSKCLFVDHLPIDYNDPAELRTLFSVHKSPSYCQIGTRNGQPLGFGLVEFEKADEAEETQRQLNHRQIGESKIRVTYCIPGYPAIVIYNKLTSAATASNGKKPLLPDPPSATSATFGQLQLMNPHNSHGFQHSQSNGDQQQRFQTNVDPDSRGSRSPPLHRPSSHGLLGSGPPSPATSSPSVASLTPPPSPQLRNDAGGQAALVLLMATHLQSQLGIQKHSLLGNPQVLSLVQAVLKQQGHQLNSSSENCDGNNNFGNVQRSESRSTDASGLKCPPSSTHNGSCPSGAQQWSGQGAYRSPPPPPPPMNGGNSWPSPPSAPLLGNPLPSFRSHKVPLLPDPPASRIGTGLLPTPDLGVAHRNTSGSSDNAKPWCQRSSGHQHNHHHQCSRELLESPNSTDGVYDNATRVPFPGATPPNFVRNGGQRAPLLGDRPGSGLVGHPGFVSAQQTTVPPPVLPPSQPPPPPNSTLQGLQDQAPDLSKTGFCTTMPSRSAPTAADVTGAIQNLLPLLLSHPQLLGGDANGNAKTQLAQHLAQVISAAAATAAASQQQQLQANRGFGIQGSGVSVQSPLSQHGHQLNGHQQQQQHLNVVNGSTFHASNVAAPPSLNGHAQHQHVSFALPPASANQLIPRTPPPPLPQQLQQHQPSVAANFGGINLAALAHMQQQQLSQSGLNPALACLLLQMTAAGGQQDAAKQAETTVAGTVNQMQQQQHRPTFYHQQQQQQIPNGYPRVLTPATAAANMSPAHKMLFATNPLAQAAVAAAQHGALGFGSSPFLLPPPPIASGAPGAQQRGGNPAVHQLLAEINQRGSLLGDFWQVARGNVPAAFAAAAAARAPGSTLANLPMLHVQGTNGFNGVNKRKFVQSIDQGRSSSLGGVLTNGTAAQDDPLIKKQRL